MEFNNKTFIKFNRKNNLSFFMKHFQTSENENAERKLLSYLLNLNFNYSKMIIKDIINNKKIMKI